LILFVFFALSFFFLLLDSAFFFFLLLLLLHKGLLPLQVLETCCPVFEFEVFYLASEMFINDVSPLLRIISQTIFQVTAIEIRRMQIVFKINIFSNSSSCSGWAACKLLLRL
jgi:hypothetical protein